MDTSAFIDNLIARPGYGCQIAHIEHIPPRQASYARLDSPLPPELEGVLEDNHLLPLYSHQAAAVNHVRQGRQVMVSTASASGKSLCYNIPVLEALLSDSGSCALYLFPTKALAQDQLRSMLQLYCPELLSYEQLATFDGDTPTRERSAIKKKARLLITNPDMLHLGIMPNHQSWSRLLRRLRYVIIDEAHTYRGIFGSHVALVLRRLRRLCRHYGSNPQFICCSATIDNPGEHAQNLTGLPFSVIDEDGAPRGGKEFVFWNPPLIDETKSIRKSANSEAAALLAELVSQNIRTIAFSRSRRLTELLASYTKQRLSEISPPHADRVKAYRAGYLPQQRRQIEQELFSGRLLGVAATNALELGIDIGDLEATVLTGYPGTIASAWQQAGRSGRGRERSLSFLIAVNDPLDQYFMRHPDAFFGKSFENALVNPENPYILKNHLLCSAWELPLGGSDAEYFGPSLAAEAAALAEQGLLRQRRGLWYLAPSVSYPAQEVNIRAASGEIYSLVDTTTDSLLETVESTIALFQLHPGAIYLHQGEAYLITDLDITGRTAYAAPTNAPYYTIAREINDLRVLRAEERKFCGRTEVCLGEVEITTTVVGFKRKAQFTEEVIGEEPLEMPERHFPTVALWFDLPEEILDAVAQARLDLAGGLHAVEHAAIGILPLFAMCDRNDIGGISTPFHPDTGKSQVFIYDGYPGGVGIAEKGYELIQQLWLTTRQTVEECPCQDGCPSCIQSPKCGNNNEPLDKKAAIMILKGLTSSF